MKRRSFFQRVIGGFAVALGFPRTTLTAATGHEFTCASTYAINPLAAPNVAIEFDPIDLTHYKGDGLMLWDVPSSQWIVIPSVPGNRIYISAETKAQLDAHFWP